MLSLKVSTDNLINIPYVRALKEGGYSDSNKTCFELNEISYNTKLLILAYIEYNIIIDTFLNENTINELNFLGYDELIDKIILLDKKILAERKVFTKEEIILSYYEKYQNQLIFNKIEDYLKFIDTFNEKLISYRSKNKKNHSFIHCFTYYSKDPLNYKLLKIILNKENINLQNKNGNSALMIASRYSNTNSTEETIKMLLEHPNINVNLQNNFNWTALMLASDNSNTESTERTIKMLLKHPDINVNLQENNGWSALMLATRYSNTASTEGTVKMLLEHPDININLQDDYDWTVLMLASRYSNTESTEGTVKMLLEHPDIDINLQNIYGETALIVASKYSHTTSTEKTVKMILKYSNIYVNLQYMFGIFYF